MDGATDGDPEYVIAADAALRDYERAEDDPAEYWFGLGGDREDARQSAIIRAWKASENYDGRTGKMLHLVAQARYGILGYVESLAEDRKKMSVPFKRRTDEDGRAVNSKTGKPLWEYERDLDGIPLTDLNGEPVFSVDTSRVEYEPRTEQCEAEVHGADVEEGESRDAVRAMLGTLMLSVLETEERQVVEMSFGIGRMERSQADIARTMGLSQPVVSRMLKTAMGKLRAECQVERIMSL